ncbi:unnamed protein product [Blumeria hordei]|uniref:Uncharacterized protein n=1 Tax=Blumeria hordei TaxID=2867405 RepID=A0A383UY43_BLUHO|nr:unnamed protein product [Blumeria hordei]
MPSNSPAPRTRTTETTKKLLQCTLCSKKFSRIDHLKRHQLRHTGVKPYSCIFCSDGFTRSDNLRDHYPGCTLRQGRAIPEAARGGRRSHACDSCTAMKLGCDGKNPCNTCCQKRIECKFLRLESKGLQARSQSFKSQVEEFNRGSINFLLNEGCGSFIDCFRFPATAERRNIFNFRAQQPADLIEQYSGSDNGSYEDEPISWSVENDNFLNLMNSPYSGFQNEVAPPSHMSLRDWEPPSIQSSSIIHCVLERALTMQLSPQEQADINQHLQLIYTPSKITRFVHEAFALRHPNSPILHTPSFDIETAPLPLLTVVTIMGAIYSKNETEANAARMLLDLVEHCIFSLDNLTEEHEIRQTMRIGHFDESPFAFQTLQAAYLIMSLQFWAGTIVARKRTIESRFGVVVKVARRLHLHQTRHGQNDIISEPLWIEKECQIRLINAIYLFDCTLCFSVHYPCRFTLPEIEFDLPCEDRFFFVHHPFSIPNFLPTRQISAYESFQNLFSRIPESQDTATLNDPMGISSTDMFLLINLIFVHAHTQVVMFAPLRAHSVDVTNSNSNSPLLDATISSIKTALTRWHSIWLNMRANMSPQTWSEQDTFRNSLNYWMLIQMNIMNPTTVDSRLRLEAGYDGALHQLRGFTNGCSLYEG